MRSVESASYGVTCPQCGKTGSAEWWETDGPAFLRRPISGVTISVGFTRLPGKEPDGPRSFFGQRLVCTTCEVDADAKRAGDSRHG